MCPTAECLLNLASMETSTSSSTLHIDSLWSCLVSARIGCAQLWPLNWVAAEVCLGFWGWLFCFWSLGESPAPGCGAAQNGRPVEIHLGELLVWNTKNQPKSEVTMGSMGTGQPWIVDTWSMTYNFKNIFPWIAPCGVVSMEFGLACHCNISRCAQENNQQTTDLHQVDLKPNVNIHNIHMNHRHTHTNGDKDRNSWHDIANIFTLDHGPTRSAFLKNPPRHAWKISSRDFWRKPAHRGDPHRKTDNGCGFYGEIWGHFMTFRNGNCCVVVCFFCI